MKRRDEKIYQNGNEHGMIIGFFISLIVIVFCGVLIKIIN